MTTVNLLTMDTLPNGEYVTEPHGRRYVVTAILGKNAVGRTYQARDLSSSQSVYLHESIVPLELSGIMALANLTSRTSLRHVARVQPTLGMPWFDGVTRYFVPEVIPPDRMSEEELRAQSKKQWERWIEQLAAGLHELHRHGVAFGFTERSIATHVAVTRSGAAYWQILGGLQLLQHAPEAEFADVAALAAFASTTKLLEAPSHIRHALQVASRVEERIRAAELVRLLSGEDAVTQAPVYVPRIELGQATSVGKRDHNEDSYCVIEISDTRLRLHRPVLIAVADGMGGVEAGEVASAMAITHLMRLAREHLKRAEGIGGLSVWVQETVRAINELILEEAQRLANNMGSTLAFALVAEGVAFLGSVGDSRIYLWNPARNDGKIQRLVKDHSVVQSLVDIGVLRDEERYHHPDRNKLIRSLGDSRAGYSDEHPPLVLQQGDWLVICTDGLWEVVRDEELAALLSTAPNAQVACDRLVDMATEREAEDNATVVIARLY
ncbi:MAG: protein phosphatase 2C domain-containing protein [Thermoflexales bacterium]|nr:protein phosphatase 2C domain-containing protein [Thermoflexales bacterium]